MAATDIVPRRHNALGPIISSVRGPRRLQPGVTVQWGGRREANRRSLSVGSGRGAVDRRVRYLLGQCPRRQRGPGSPMGGGARPARVRSPPGPRRDRAGMGARPVRDRGRDARLIRPRYVSATRGVRASSSETDPAMTTSSPCRQLAGVATPLLYECATGICRRGGSPRRCGTDVLPRHPSPGG